MRKAGDRVREKADDGEQQPTRMNRRGDVRVPWPS
jgi:hypothetical protein